MDDYPIVNGATRSRDGRFYSWEPTAKENAWDRYLREVEITYKLGKRRYFQSPGLALQVAAAFRRHAETLERYAVAYARACNWSWAVIASYLDMSRSGAQKRFRRGLGAAE